MLKLTTFSPEIKQAFELGWQLFKKDLAGKYRQSLLGPLWIVLLPLISSITLFGLAKSGVLNLDSSQDPLVSVLFGMTFWTLFSGLVMEGSNSIISVGMLLSKIKIHPLAILIPSVLGPITDFMARLTLLYAMSIWRIPHFSIAAALSIFLTVIPVGVLGLSLGLLIAGIAALFRDIQKMTAFGLSLLLLLTPGIYNANILEGGLLQRLSKLNPVRHLFNFPKDLFLGNVSWDNMAMYQNYFFMSGITIVCLFVGYRFYRISLRVVVERL